MNDKPTPIFLTVLAVLGLAALLSGCAGDPPVAAAQPPLPTGAALSTPALIATPAPSPTAAPPPTITPTATPDTRPLPENWQAWPVVPTLSPHAREIFQKGVQLGNDPHAFSVIGDCQSLPEVFLGVYERGGYALGDYKYLQNTIDYFHGSFDRQSAAVKDGMSVASVLNPLWADPNQCQANETPVACELRVHKPAIMFVNLGTNWKNGGAGAYEQYLRQIVQIVIDHGTLPVLTTKADNIEGDHSLDLATARVAYDLDVPLMNFWLASTQLPNNGLDPAREDVYLTVQGWNLRNFYALQTLDTVWKYLQPGQK